MNVITSRGKYIVSCDADPAQIATKIELFIWKFDQTEPTTPTKVIEKNVFSQTQHIMYYNISPYVSDFLKPFIVNDMAVNVKIVKYYKLTTDWVLDSETDAIGVYAINNNGFSDYSFLENPFGVYPYYFYPLDYPPFGQYVIPYIDLLIDYSLMDGLRVIYSSTLGSETVDYTDTGIKYYRIPLTTENAFFVDGNDVTFQSFDGVNYTNFTLIEGIKPICETKFEPFVIDYVNFYGGLSRFTFFKKSSKSWSVKSDDYNLSNVYPNTISEKKVFNKNGRDTIKLNTGWINEKYVDNIKQLTLSEDLYLAGSINGFGGKVILKNTSFETKTNLNDKVINYEMEFEFVTDIIQ